MKLPNVSSLFKWINPFFPGAKGGSSDFVQCIRQSDGQILSWVDENGFLQGNFALSVPEEDADPASIWLEDDFMSQTGTAQGSPLGSLNWLPGVTGFASADISTSAFPNAGAVS